MRSWSKVISDAPSIRRVTVRILGGQNVLALFHDPIMLLRLVIGMDHVAHVLAGRQDRAGSVVKRLLLFAVHAFLPAYGHGLQFTCVVNIHPLAQHSRVFAVGHIYSATDLQFGDLADADIRLGIEPRNLDKSARPSFAELHIKRGVGFRKMLVSGAMIAAEIIQDRCWVVGGNGPIILLDSVRVF